VHRRVGTEGKAQERGGAQETNEKIKQQGPKSQFVPRHHGGFGGNFFLQFHIYVTREQISR